MAEYEHREQRYNDNIGQVVGRFCTAIVEADALSKDAYARRMLELVKAPSAEFQAESSSIIGMEQSLVTTIKTPMMTIMDNRPIVIDEAKLELDMTVIGAHRNVGGDQERDGTCRRRERRHGVRSRSRSASSPTCRWRRNPSGQATTVRTLTRKSRCGRAPYRKDSRASSTP